MGGRSLGALKLESSLFERLEYGLEDRKFFPIAALEPPVVHRIGVVSLGG